MNIFILCNVFFFFPEMLLCILNNFNGYISIPHSDLLSTCSDILSFCFKPNYFMKRFLNTIKNLLFSLQRFFFFLVYYSVHLILMIVGPRFSQYGVDSFFIELHLCEIGQDFFSVRFISNSFTLLASDIYTKNDYLSIEPCAEK